MFGRYSTAIARKSKFTHWGRMNFLETSKLRLGYLRGGPSDGPAVLLLHGWPDDVRTWASITPVLNAAGYQTIAPWSRGFGPTRFLSPETVRDGRIEALAQDAIDLMDGLGVARFAVVGHDWGARVAYALAALIPDRLTTIAALSVGYAPRGEFPIPDFRQSRAWWYHWFMSVDRGAEAVSRDPKGFARIQWETWSPAGWFDESEFEATAESFENPDWIAITLNAYRGRWRDGERRDPEYDLLHQRIVVNEKLTVPTLMIQGAVDGTVLPHSSEDKEVHFADYERLLLDGVGHFPSREAPTKITAALLDHFARYKD